MGQSLRASLHRVADPRHLDESVDEVFRMMLGVACQQISPAAIQHRETNTDLNTSANTETITAVVGFGGLLSGACVFQANAPAALAIAATLTGMELVEIDETVKDAIGEICNMIAGTWKGKVPELAANCGLSIPAVIAGRHYDLHVQAPEFRLDRSYRFNETGFTVTIICDGLR